MQCRGIGPHLAARGKSHDFSRVAVGTWGIFSRYSGDGHLNLVFVQRHQDSRLVIWDTPISHEPWQGNTDASRGEVVDRGSLSSCHSDIWIPINFQHESGIVIF